MEYEQNMSSSFKSFISTVTSILSVAFIVYVGALFAWLVLMYGCTETHSVAECRDNTLTSVVTYPFDLIRSNI